MHFAGDELQYGSPAVVEAERSRCGVEAGALKVLQERVYRRRPSGCSPTDSVPDPHARAKVAAQGDLVGFRTAFVVRHA